MIAGQVGGRLDNEKKKLLKFFQFFFLIIYSKTSVSLPPECEMFIRSDNPFLHDTLHDIPRIAKKKDQISPSQHGTVQKFIAALPSEFQILYLMGEKIRTPPQEGRKKTETEKLQI